MPRNYGASFPAWVPLNYTGGQLKYAFKCRLQRDSVLPTLGVTKILTTPTDVTGFIFGANAPKPPRASKTFDTNPPGSESTFCSNAITILTNARADGWRITPGKPFRKPISTTRSKTVYVTLNGIKYAWQFSRIPASLTGVDTSALGIQDASATESGLVFGASFPKPPKVKKEVNDTDDPTVDSFSTFCDPSRLDSAISAGYAQVTVKKYNRVTAEDLDVLL